MEVLFKDVRRSFRNCSRLSRSLERSFNPFSRTWSDEESQVEIVHVNDSDESAQETDYVLASRSKQTRFFDDVARSGQLGSVINEPSFTEVNRVSSASQSNIARGSNTPGPPPPKKASPPKKATQPSEVDDTPGTLFFLYLYLSGTMYGSMLLLAAGAFLFAFFNTGYFDSEKERDFFQLAMIGFAAMFGWVLLSMWVSYREKNYGWAFLSSLPSLAVIALVVIVLTTGDCCQRAGFASQQMVDYPTAAMASTTPPPTNYYDYYP